MTATTGDLKSARMRADERDDVGRGGDVAKHQAVDRRRRRGPLAAALAVALAAGLVLPATAVGDDDLRQKKQRVNAALDDAHDEILSFNKKVAHATRSVLNARAKLPAARANLARAEAEQRRTAAANRLAEQQLEQAAAEVLLAEQKMADLEGRISELQANVGDFARRAYQMGPYAELEVVLEAQDPSDFTDRLAAIRTVSESNAAALEQMGEDRADLAYTEQRLAALRQVAQAKQEQAQARFAEAQEAAAGARAAKRIVDGLIAQEEAALRATRTQRANIKAQYEELEAEQERIQAKIRAAAARLAASTGVKTDGDVSAVDSGTQWYFPVPGYAIGSDAGWRYHPILHYVRCHAGADIGAPSGAPIHAVESGTVIIAGWNGGYGNFTVIDHGGGVTSGYGHQSSINVHVGEHVSRGEVIGAVGSTGLSTGPHLHFEARINGQPYSPKGWFGQGPKVAVCT